MSLNSFRDLTVWNRSISLVAEVYKVTKKLPKIEHYGLASQAQRSAVSIPANIAEGYARKGTAEYIRFLSMAFGSAAELETHLVIMGQQYETIDLANAESLLNEVQKMLRALIRSLKK